ncbi:hypothetical protein HK405_004108 [Cladochytrium tenue]|nr:hypothetical protein HK405_004108 [Cladochytrium tenue]
MVSHHHDDFAQAAAPDRRRQWVALLSDPYHSEPDGVFTVAAAAGLDVSVLAKKFGVPPPSDLLHGAIQADSSHGGESLSALAADCMHLKKSASNDEFGETPTDAMTGGDSELPKSREGSKAGVVLLAIVLKSLRKYAPDIFSMFTKEMAARTKNRDFANAFISTLARMLYDALDAMRGLCQFWTLAMSKLSLLQMIVKACVLLVDELRKIVESTELRTFKKANYDSHYYCQLYILYE